MSKKGRVKRHENGNAQRTRSLGMKSGVYKKADDEIKDEKNAVLGIQLPQVCTLGHCPTVTLGSAD